MNEEELKEYESHPEGCFCNFCKPDEETTTNPMKENKIKGTKESVCNDCYDDGFKGSPCPHIEVVAVEDITFGFNQALDTVLTILRK